MFAAWPTVTTIDPLSSSFPLFIVVPSVLKANDALGVKLTRL